VQSPARGGQLLSPKERQSPECWHGPAAPERAVRGGLTWPCRTRTWPRETSFRTSEKCGLVFSLGLLKRKWVLQGLDCHGVHIHLYIVCVWVYTYSFKKVVYVYVVYVYANICLYRVLARLFSRLIKDATFKLQNQALLEKHSLTTHYQ